MSHARRAHEVIPPRLIMFYDMNSYFATVEQQANPFWRGRSVGVCARLSDNGCIIASSREAKAKGIVTGTRIREARALDSGVILIECRPALYRAITGKIYALVSEYAGMVEPYSIDEAFLDLTGLVRSAREAQDTAQRIQSRMRSEVGDWLSCSIGIAPTRWIAKFLADVGAKGGITTAMSREELVPYLADAPLTDAWGINKRLAVRFHHLGIRTLLELRDADPIVLKRSLGLLGYLLWAQCNGIETLGPLLPTAPKSIGHSYVLPHSNRDLGFLDRVLLKLGERVGRQLRRKQLDAHGAYVSWSSRDSHSGGHIRQAVPFHDTGIFLPPLRHILRERYHGEFVSRLATGVYDVCPRSGQRLLFPDPAQHKRERLRSTIDTLWDRYGDFSIRPGTLVGMDPFALDRVGFRKTVDVSLTDPLPIHYRHSD